MPREGRTHAPEPRAATLDVPVAWACYDGIADAYARVAAPRYFLPPARHLVGLLQPRPSERFLDVGCGTGVVAAEAAAVMGSTRRVAGVDPAPAMLAQARGAAVGLVAAGLPALPWRERCFDVAAGAFVLNHLADVPAALAEIRHLLRPGGRLGVSTWGRSPSQNPAGELWGRVASAFVDSRELRAALRQQLPGEERLSEPAELAQELTAAGFAAEVAEVVPFAVTLSTDEYVESRLLSLGSRFIEHVLPAAEWRRFARSVRGTLRQAFGSELVVETSVAFAVGRTPAAG